MVAPYTVTKDRCGHSIEIAGWKITTVHGPISGADDLDQLSNELGLPLPEMVFGSSSLSLHHVPSSFRYEFNTKDALKRVDAVNPPTFGPPDAASSSVTIDRIEVASAKAWSKDRSSLTESIKDVIKPYDWTYSTDYLGTVPSSAANHRFTATAVDRIDYVRLQTQEDILMYDEIVLFEDELADNGTSMLSAKIRVMASGFFVLLRFFLRVDGVMFRVQDTRIYHAFGSNIVLREMSGGQLRYDDVKFKVRVSNLAKFGASPSPSPFTSTSTSTSAAATGTGSSPSRSERHLSANDTESPELRIALADNNAIAALLNPPPTGAHAADAVRGAVTEKVTLM
ncbi:TIP41-domain-containing protein [Ramicandelaber brevisporus]|nr:TIP41-domain-containing protein [Ramicandelaber brevisporus]